MQVLVEQNYANKIVENSSPHMMMIIICMGMNIQLFTKFTFTTKLLSAAAHCACVQI
jgi:hypothetical protein